MLQTIFKYEWILLARNKGLIAAIVVFTAIGFYCLKQGKSIYNYQQTTVDSATAKKNRNYHAVKNIFDTLTYNNAERNDIEQAFVIEWRLQDVVAKNISPLSILSIGQSDVYAPLLSGHFNSDIFKNNYAEFKNPEQLLAGNLDTAFFIVFLFPLLLLALTYNLQSADKEAGISPLLNAQASSILKLMRYRLLYRWLVALFPFIITAVASFFMLSALPGFSFVVFMQWWGIALLYAFFWLLVVALVQRFQFSSLINAIILAGVWVLLLIAIPGLLNTWFNYKYPAANKTEIAEYRDFDFKTWNKPLETHKHFLFDIYPQFQKDSAKLDSNEIRNYSYSLQVLNKEKELHAAITQQANEQATAEEKTFWINPVGGIMRSFANISQTSLRQQNQFEKDILRYREQKLNHIYQNVLLQPHFTKKDFEGLPNFSGTENNPGSLKYLLPLMVLMTIASIITIVKRKLKTN
jgi:ABC-2 type transport system permease protein